MRREADCTGRLKPGGILHAVEARLNDSIRPMCQGRRWRPSPPAERLDYRYREPGNQCRHIACVIAFREQLVG